MHPVSDETNADLTPRQAEESKAAQVVASGSAQGTEPVDAPAVASEAQVASSEVAQAGTAETGTAESGAAEPGTAEPGTAEPVAADLASSVGRRRRVGVAVLVAIAAISGAVGSWVYNHGYKVRAANNSAVIRSGADLSTYVSPGDYTAVTVPIRNDSPFDVTVIGLTVPNAPKLQWDNLRTVIPPNSTANLRLFTRGECEAAPHALKQRGPVTVVVRVLTINGKMHGSLQELINGAIQYADDRCAIPSASESV